MLTMSFFTTLLGSIMAPKVLTALGSALGLILLDFVLGVLLSLKQCQFDVRKLPQCLQTGVLPYVGALTFLALFVGISPGLEALFFACTAAVAVKYLADLKDKLGEIFTGIQLQSPVAIKTVSIPAAAQEQPTQAPDPAGNAQPRAPDATA